MAVEEGGGGVGIWLLWCILYEELCYGEKNQLETSHKRVLCKFACLPLKTFNNNE